MRGFMLCLFFGVAGADAVEFGSAFSSGMVVQRDAPLRLTGKGSPGAEVMVSVDAVEKSARVSGKGIWSVDFPALKAGGPHVMKAVEGASSVTLDGVKINAWDSELWNVADWSRKK